MLNRIQPLKNFGRSVPARENSKYKGFAAVMNLRCTREEKKASVSGYSECVGEGER